jgi:hypothetical protein
LLDRLDFPDPWRSNVIAAVALIDDLDRQIHTIERELRELGADHRYVALWQTVPGIAWVSGYTIAAEAATNAVRHPASRARYQATKARLGRHRGAKVAQIDIARRLTEAIWHMLARNQPFAPAGAASLLAA